jgi:hypothetical protein
LVLNRPSGKIQNQSGAILQAFNHFWLLFRSLYNFNRGVAQSGSGPALGAGSRRFKSSRPDQLQTKTMKIKQFFKNIVLYFLDSIENIFYEETLNEYGSEHATKSQVMKYVKKLKEKMKD